MSGVETNFTVDSVILENITDYSGFTGDAKLAEKGYVDYLYNLNMGSLTSELDGLRMQVDGITGDLILSQYNTIIEIADQLLNFGDTGTTGTIYNLTTSYGLAVGAREVSLLGFTGELAAERDRAVTSEQSLTDKLSQETTAFTNADTAERLARIAADVGLTGGLLTEIDNFNSAIAAETAARIAADVGLTGDLLTYQASNDFKLAHITFSGHTGATGHYMNDANIKLKNIKTAGYGFIGGTGVSVLNSPYVSSSSSQGSSLSMSADGMYIAVGNKYHYDNNFETTGSVSVYKKNSDGTWTLQKDNNNNLLLIDLDVDYGYGQGESVSISGDGSKLAVGSENKVVIYSRSGSVWTKLQRLTSPQYSSKFGYSLDFSKDGNTLVIGDYEWGNDYNGKVFVYSFNGTNYSYEDGFVGSENSSGFGSRVVISGDGNRILVTNRQPSTYGAAWVFVKNNGSWNQEGSRIVISAGIGHTLGLWSDISYDGTILAISSIEPGLNRKGQIHLFSKQGSNWSITTTISAPATTPDQGFFGSSLSLTDDGKNMVVVTQKINTDNKSGISYYNNVNGTWAISGSVQTFNDITQMPNNDVGTISSIATGGSLSNGYVFGCPFSTSTYSAGAAFYVSSYELNSTYSPAAPNNPYYLQLSNKWRITPNATFSALRFQKYVDGAWTDVATLNKL